MRPSAIAVAAIAAATLVALPASRSAQESGGSGRSGASGAVQRLDDATIVAIFDAANSADIETGALAVERGASKEVRDFGAMLVRDHEQVRRMGRDLARKLGVTPTPPADDASARRHAEAMAALRALKGAEFDHAFLRHEAAFHEAVLAAVRSTLLPAIRNGELRELVVRVAPAFEAHMLAARNLDRKLAAAGGR